MIHQGGELGNGVIGEYGCCEPRCVRVDQAHLWPATQSENIRHAVRQGWNDRAYRLARPMLTHDKDQLVL